MTFYLFGHKTFSFIFHVNCTDILYHIMDGPKQVNYLSNSVITKLFNYN
jgi:hypothetical protein